MLHVRWKKVLLNWTARSMKSLKNHDKHRISKQEWSVAPPVVRWGPQKHRQTNKQTKYFREKEKRKKVSWEAVGISCRTEQSKTRRVMITLFRFAKLVLSNSLLKPRLANLVHFVERRLLILLLWTSWSGEKNYWADRLTGKATVTSNLRVGWKIWSVEELDTLPTVI